MGRIDARTIRARPAQPFEVHPLSNLITRTIALRTGFPLDYVQAVAKELRKAGAWSLTNLLLAIHAEAEPASAASVARHYASLNSELGQLGEVIDAITNSFREQRRNEFSIAAYHSGFEIYNSRTPEVVMRIPHEQGVTKIIFHDSNEPECLNRQSWFLTGKRLFDIVADLKLRSEGVYVY